jgi:CRISPR-associated protein Cmr2
MARKPREMWAASYLFSYLMKCIIKVLPKDDIISPAIIKDSSEKNESEKKSEPIGIGLYPDRIFIKGEIAYDTIKPAIDTFAKTLKIDADYFNVMLTSDDYTTDAKAVKGLNRMLDCMELFNLSSPQSAKDKVRDLIMLPYGSTLFVDAFGQREFPVESLGEIAAVEFKDSDSKQWAKFKGAIRNKDSKVAEKAYNELPKEKLKSYHKYICVVQADGDNMGTTVTHSSLPEGKVKEISEALLKFGEDATKAIKEFGGLPIYAGGDDLLFIAPLVGKNHKSILHLLDKLNNESFGNVRKLVEDMGLQFEGGKQKGEPIQPSLSFGVSVSYYKYPLYEAHESAKKLLFGNAKHVKGKNAIALDLRKHSGGTFNMSMSCNKAELKKAFDELVEASMVDESIISAIAHKIRENEGLLSVWVGKADAETRNSNFFRKYVEHSPEKKEEDKNDSDRYKDAVLNLMNNLSKLSDMTAPKLSQTLYGMLRLAKFINGEEVRDE